MTTTCERKSRYDTEGMALRAAGRERARSGLIIKEYHCEDCGGWHIGRVSLKALRPR
jgi:hypothetical protein